MQQMEQSVGISVFFEPGISAEEKIRLGKNKEKRRYCHDAVCIC